MCGRSRQTVAPQALASAVGFNGNVPLRRASRYVRRENAHPGNATPIAYRTAAGSNALRSMRWGLVPSFTKKGDKPDFFRMFNARSETAAEKPSFRRLVGRRHGVVAFTGFYEWKRDEKGERQPYYFYFSDGRPLLFAVLYDTWQQGDGFGGSGSVHKSRVAAGPESTPDVASKETEGQTAQTAQTALLEREVEEEDRGESLMFSYAVLTTSAAPRLEWLHERMPVILRGPGDAAAWLGCKGAEASTFLKNHTPYSGEDLVWHPVSKQMNTMRYDAEDCSAAIELKKPKKPLPAITTFFKKTGPADPAPSLPAATATTAAGGGGSGGSANCGARHGQIGEEQRDEAGAGDDAVAAVVGPGTTEAAAAAAAKTHKAAFLSSPAKRPRPGGEDARSRGGVAAAARTGPHAPSSPRPAVAAGGGRSSGASSAGKRARTAAGSPSPRKGGGSKAGAAAAAAATKDKKQPKLTSFFSAPC